MPVEVISPGPAVSALRSSGQRTLRDGFLRSSERFPARPALEVDGCTLTYEELRLRSAAVAATLAREAAPDGPPLTACLAYRTPTAFVGVLAPLLSGHGYVPLNPRFPVERNRLVFQRSGVRALIVGAEALESLVSLVEGSAPGLLIVVPDVQDVDALAAKLPQHRVIGAGGLEPADAWRPAEVSRDSLAYLLFTSGSTGIPKGVMIAHRNVLHYVDTLVER